MYDFWSDLSFLNFFLLSFFFFSMNVVLTQWKIKAHRTIERRSILTLLILSFQVHSGIGGGGPKDPTALKSSILHLRLCPCTQFFPTRYHVMELNLFFKKVDFSPVVATGPPVHRWKKCFYSKFREKYLMNSHKETGVKKQFVMLFSQF